MEREAVDLVGTQLPARDGREPPVMAVATDPAGERPTIGKDGIHQRERLGRQLEHRLAGREADGPVPEHPAERRIAVDDDMAGSRREARWTREGPVKPRVVGTV